MHQVGKYHISKLKSFILSTGRMTKLYRRLWISRVNGWWLFMTRGENCDVSSKHYKLLLLKFVGKIGRRASCSFGRACLDLGWRVPPQPEPDWHWAELGLEWYVGSSCARASQPQVLPSSNWATPFRVFQNPRPILSKEDKECTILVKKDGLDWVLGN